MKALPHRLWIVFVFLWAWSIPLLGFDLVPPGTEWMGSVILVLAGSLATIWLVQRFGRRGLGAAAAVALGGWAAEHLGVTTGWPFGEYVYTDVLSPKIGGVVPLAIPFAWLMVVPGALSLANALFRVRNGIAQVLIAATLAMGLDVVIEPVAVYINRYWIWAESGPLVGIPTSNFIAWWGLALGLGSITRFLTGPWDHSPTIELPAAIFILNLGLFSAVNLLRGQITAGLIGLAFLLIGGALMIAGRQVRWTWKHHKEHA